MGFLPIPGKLYINDFPDKTTYAIYRNNDLVATSDGITNSDEDGKHIAFLYGTNVMAGDAIRMSNGKLLAVKFTDTDYYNGEPSIIKAYY